MWYVFDAYTCQWPGMGRDLMILDCFRESIMRSDALLRPYNVRLCDLLMDGEDETFTTNDTVNSFVGIVAIQVSPHANDSKCSCN